MSIAAAGAVPTKTPVSNDGAFLTVNDALAGLLEVLSAYVPMTTWLFARVDSQYWTVIQAKSSQDSAVFSVGDKQAWRDTVSRRMVEGAVPRYAENAQSVVAFREAATSLGHPIGAYVGQPIYRGTEGLFGTLCGFSTAAVSGFTDMQRMLIETTAKLASNVIEAFMAREQSRQTEVIAQPAAQLDALTKLGNLEAWEAALAEEEQALAPLAENAVVLVLDLDGMRETNATLGRQAADAFLKKAAKVLRTQMRERDVICRVGGDEFGVLVRGGYPATVQDLVTRLSTAFDNAFMGVSVGLAMRLDHGTLFDAAAAADLNMQEEKRKRMV